jgi:hypothetical protein
VGEWLYPGHVTSGIDANPYIKLRYITRAKKVIDAASEAQPQRRFLHPTYSEKMSTLAQKNGMRSATVKVGLRVWFMAGVVTIRVTTFLLVAACGALCQESPMSSSLPDAPSALVAGRTETFKGPAEEAIPRFAVDSNRGVTRESGLANIARHRYPTFIVLRNDAVQKESNDFFGKYLYPSLLRRNLNYRPSSSSSLVGRAVYAASRIFVTRDESGKGRVNTSYFLGVLSSAAIRTAYRPYWARSASAPFSDFGSTVGNDAGMNLLHEFRPGLQQLMKAHAPKFVSRIEERIGHN